MKKNWIKKLVAVLVFFVALFVADGIMNRGNTEITWEMPKATLPVVSVQVGQRKINPMYGYTSKRQQAFTKGSITPVTDSRKISFVVDTFGANIDAIAYEVRSIDGERLIEGSQIKDSKKEGEEIFFSLQLKDLIEENEEYSFVIILTLEDGTKAHYYTRFIQNEEYHEQEKIEFVTKFHETTFGDGDGQEIKKYLETSSKGDNSNFHKVNINSSLKQVMWDELPIERVEKPVIQIRDISVQTAGIILQYVAKEKGQQQDKLYFVEEYYRVRYTPNRMYLLDYERTMDEVFKGDKNSFKNDKVRLGIYSEDFPMMESEGGKNVAFINANRLFVFNTIDNTLSRVFSFYDDFNFDLRTINQDFTIQILNMEDSGNLTFMVAGYMNRGIHEGEVGIAVYYYNSIQNMIEEQIFIPYEKSTGILTKELENYSYLNKNNHLFLILEGSLYDVSLEDKNYRILISDLQEGSYKTSSSGRMITWIKDGIYKSNNLTWLNLNDGKQVEIKAGFGERITPMGFIGEDLVYGLVKNTDITKDAAGNTFFPAYKVVIKNQDDKVLKNYEKEGIYIIGSEIADNQITLKRNEKRNDTFVPVEDDHIASKETDEYNVNQVRTVNEEIYKQTVQIILKNTVEPNALKVLTPKEVIFEGGRDVYLELEGKDRFYVYGPYGVADITSSSSKAVNEGYSLSGSVVDSHGNYIWKKGRIYSKNQIMAITGTKKDNERSSLAVCLDTILQYEGISRQTQPLLDQGEDAFNILKNSLRKEKILDLTGCNLDSVLYYVDQDIPVLALTQDGEAVLIIGFNEQNTVLMDPKTGLVFKKGMNDSKAMFEESGNNFISYVRMEE